MKPILATLKQRKLDSGGKTQAAPCWVCGRPRVECFFNPCKPKLDVMLDKLIGDILEDGNE